MHATRTLLALAALLAAAPAAPAELKIGYVDFQRALNEVDEGKSAKAVLKRDFEEKQKQLDRDKAELERLEADLRKQEAVLSDEAKRERFLDLQRKASEAAQKLQAFQKELSDREREATRAIFDKMVGVTREIADAEGFTLVFERNDSGLVVGPASLDLTNELVRKYNARHKAGAAEKKAEKPAAKKDEKKPAEKPAAAKDERKPEAPAKAQ